MEMTSKSVVLFAIVQTGGSLTKKFIPLIIIKQNYLWKASIPILIAVYAIQL
jgi:hypothetical protein